RRVVVVRGAPRLPRGPDGQLRLAVVEELHQPDHRSFGAVSDVERPTRGPRSNRRTRSHLQSGHRTRRRGRSRSAQATSAADGAGPRGCAARHRRVIRGWNRPRSDDNRVRMLRSLLNVPGNRPDMLEKATSYGADALIIDLEDSVPL